MTTSQYDPQAAPAVPREGERKTDVRWFYAPSPDAESWEGPHDSLDDAIEAARSDYTGCQSSFWVDEALPVDWERTLRNFVDADDQLERFAEYVGDEHVEDPEPEFKTSKEEAQAALEQWAVEHLAMRPYWQCVGSAKVYPVSDPPPAQPSRTNSVGMGDERSARGTLDRIGEASAVAQAEGKGEQSIFLNGATIRAVSERRLVDGKLVFSVPLSADEAKWLSSDDVPVLYACLGIGRGMAINPVVLEDEKMQAVETSTAVRRIQEQAEAATWCPKHQCALPCRWCANSTEPVATAPDGPEGAPVSELVVQQGAPLKLAQDVPEPPAITDEVRAKLVSEGKEWRAGVAKQSAAIEAIAFDIIPCASEKCAICGDSLDMHLTGRDRLVPVDKFKAGYRCSECEQAYCQSCIKSAKHTPKWEEPCNDAEMKLWVNAVTDVPKLQSEVERLTKERDESLALPSGKYFSMVRRALGPCLGGCSSWADLTAHASSVVTKNAELDDLIALARGERDHAIELLEALRAEMIAHQEAVATALGLRHEGDYVDKPAAWDVLESGAASSRAENASLSERLIAGQDRVTELTKLLDEERAIKEEWKRRAEAAQEVERGLNELLDKEGAKRTLVKADLIEAKQLLSKTKSLLAPRFQPNPERDIDARLEIQRFLDRDLIAEAPEPTPGVAVAEDGKPE